MVTTGGRYCGAVADGNGGAIFTYFKYVSDRHVLYAQRIDAGANRMWGPDGVLVSELLHPGVYTRVRITTNRRGGAVIAWKDGSSSPGKVLAQSLDGDGNTLWPAGGVCVGESNLWTTSVEIVPDNAGGVYILLKESGSDAYSLRAQRIDFEGDILWPLEGVSVSSTLYANSYYEVIPDGQGGCIATWVDCRGDGAASGADVYAQRLDGSGGLLWGEGGVAVCSAEGKQQYPCITTNGYGGCFISWMDSRYGEDPEDRDVYLQMIDGRGNARWSPDGNSVCASDFYQGSPAIAPDGQGGAIVAWVGYSAQEELKSDIYAQRIDANGNAVWSGGGVVVSDKPAFEQTPLIYSDGCGGAFIAWFEHGVHTDRGSIPIPEYSEGVYLQAIDAYGNTRWNRKGEYICTVNRFYYDYFSLVCSGAREIIAAWDGWRDGMGGVLAQRYTVWQWRRTCATSSIGATEPSRKWYLAEGATAGGFETWVLMANPGEEAALVNVTYHTDQGEVAGPELSIPPHSRLSVNAGDSVQSFHVSTMVSSNKPVVAERATYLYGNR